MNKQSSSYYMNNIQVDLTSKRILNGYFKRKHIHILDILEYAGFDTSKESKIYFGKSPNGIYELTYEYDNKKYTLNLYNDRYVEITEYTYYDNGKERQYNSYCLYKINI